MTSTVRFPTFDSMRAARILNMLLVLQRRGKLTAAELSEALEVSERTVLRDVAALSEAGVPIYTVQGHEGGIELLDGFETRLTGLETDEAGALFLAGQPEVAHRLGLGVAARTARDKLLHALSPAGARAAEDLGEWFVHDPDPMAGHEIPHGELRRIADAIGRRRRIELHFAAAPMVTCDPLGLVLNAGDWWIAARTDGTVELRELADLRGTRITRQPFERPDGFVLAEVWAAHLASH